MLPGYGFPMTHTSRRTLFAAAPHLQLHVLGLSGHENRVIGEKKKKKDQRRQENRRRALMRNRDFFLYGLNDLINLGDFQTMLDVPLQEWCGDHDLLAEHGTNQHSSWLFQ